MLKYFTNGQFNGLMTRKIADEVANADVLVISSVL